MLTRSRMCLSRLHSSLPKGVRSFMSKNTRQMSEQEETTGEITLLSSESCVIKKQGRASQFGAGGSCDISAERNPARARMGPKYTHGNPPFGEAMHFCTAAGSLVCFRLILPQIPKFTTCTCAAMPLDFGQEWPRRQEATRRRDVMITFDPGLLPSRPLCLHTKQHREVWLACKQLKIILKRENRN